MERTFAEARWVRQPRVPPNTIGFVLGVALAVPLVFALVAVAGDGRASETALKIGAMTIGFACISAGVGVARRALGARTVPVAVTSGALRIGALELKAADLERIAHGLVRGETPTRPGHAPTVTEDTRVEVRLRGGRVIRLLALDQKVVDVAGALAPLERANPELVVLPADLVPRDSKRVTRLVYGGIALLVASGIGWLAVSDWLEARARERADRARDEAIARDPDVVAILTRLDVERGAAGAPTCAAVDDAVPVVEASWRDWLVSKRDYTKRPERMSADSDAFRYLADWVTPGDADGWKKRQREVEALLDAPRVAVLDARGDLVVYAAKTGAAECVAAPADARGVVADLEIRNAPPLLLAPR